MKDIDCPANYVGENYRWRNHVPELKPGSLGHKITWFFAFVGFIASVVTILSYFSRPTTGTLTVWVKSNHYVVPSDILAPMREDSRIDALIDQAIERCGERRQSSSSAGRSRSPTTRPSNEACAEARQLRMALNWLNQRHARTSFQSDYVVHNGGSDAARQIRLDSTNASFAEMLRGNVFVPLNRSRVHGDFDLPNLNPGEDLYLRVWSSSIDNGAPRLPTPRVSFQGTAPVHKFLHGVDSGWYSLSRRFSYLPPWSFELFAFLGLMMLGSAAASFVTSVGKRIFS